MGKSSKPKVEVTEYSMSMHFGICAGPVDALTRITVKEKDAWTGEQTALGTITIDNAELFGGVKKEGGLRGTVHYLPGASDQLLPDALAQKLGRANGADCPGFRGLTSLFFVGSDRAGFYWTANTPYLPGVWATARRAPVGLDPDYALVPRQATTPVFNVVATVDLDAVTNAATSAAGAAAVGVTLSGFDPADTIRVTMPLGGTYVAWSPWGEPALTGDDTGSKNAVSVVPDATPANKFVLGSGTYDGYEAARAAFGTHTFTGASSYTFYINDTPIEDNTGGVSILVESADAFGFDANPAHIIYECLTNTDWGMGSPTAALDTDEFEAAAVTLYGEGFGLSMLWTRQAEIQDFVQEVLDHIQGVIYVDPSTGLLTLKLIRDDYDAEYLPELTPDNADLSNFGRKLWGEIVNEITVTWTNPENEQEETVTAQDDASIATQGGPVSDSRNYYGVRSGSLAQQLAWRDLRSAGQPLASCEAEVDRTQWDLRPASVVKLTWPEHGLSGVVMRVTSIDYGRPGDPSIKLSLIEDVYGLDIGTYEDPPTSEWEDPSAEPEAFETVEIFTMPLFFAADTSVAAFIDSPEYPELVAGVLATTENTDAFDYELWDEVTLPNGSLEWQSLGTNNIIGRGELVGALALEAISEGVSFENVTGQTSPTVGGFLIIGEAGETGNEIAMVDADNGDDYGYDVVRGVLDTVPREWPVGTPVWFVDGSTLFEDSLVRSAAEEVDYKLRMRTSQGLLALSAAPLESYTLTERPWLPNRPANVTAFGEAWSSEDAPIDATANPNAYITVTWANRNRLTEDSQVLAWTDADATPETGQTTTIEVRAGDGTLLATHDGLTGTSYNVPDSSFGTNFLIRLRVYAERTDGDGDFVSLQYFEHWVQIGTTLTFDSTAVTWDSDAYTWDDEWPGS